MTNAEFYLNDLKTKFAKINPSEYYLSYSGGKDSHLLYWFIKEYAPEFKNIKVVAVNTYMEHPEIRKRMYDNADLVLLPTMKPFEIKEKYGIPCFSKLQDDFIYRYQKGSRCESVMNRIYSRNKDGSKSWFGLSKKARELLLSGKLHRVSNRCCMKLKKEPMHNFEKETGLKAILGVRGNESRLRKAQYKSCFTKDMKFTPLWDLTTELEKEIYEQFKIPQPYIYIYGLKGLGCMGCPYGSYKGDTEIELSILDEKQHDFVCEYFKESYEVLGIDTSRQMSFDEI